MQEESAGTMELTSSDELDPNADGRKAPRRWLVFVACLLGSISSLWLDYAFGHRPASPTPFIASIHGRRNVYFSCITRVKVSRRSPRQQIDGL